MKNRFSSIFRLLVLMLACVGLLAQLSCSHTSSTDMVIVDPGNGVVVPLQHSTFRQTVLQIDDESAVFSTITLDSERKNTLLRQYDLKGLRLREIVLPKFLDGYAGGGDYGASPDGKYIVYRKRQNLRLLDLSTKQDTVVLADVMPKYGRVLIRWIAEKRVLLVSELPYQDGEEPSRLYQIAEINISTGEIKKLFEHAYLADPRSTDLSYDARFFVIRDTVKKHGLYEKLSILELSTGKLIDVAGSEMSSYFGATSWCPDSHALAFVESGKFGETIRVWNEGGFSTKELLVAEKRHLIYGVLWADDLIAYYSGDPNSTRSAKMVLVDENNGKIKRNVDIYVNGKIFYLPKSKKIIAEVNY